MGTDELGYFYRNTPLSKITQATIIQQPSYSTGDVTEAGVLNATDTFTFNISPALGFFPKAIGQKYTLPYQLDDKTGKITYLRVSKNTYQYSIDEASADNKKPSKVRVFEDKNDNQTIDAGDVLSVVNPRAYPVSFTR